MKNIEIDKTILPADFIWFNLCGKLRFGKRKHRGSLEDSLKTSKAITEREFMNMIGDYHPYWFDKRVRQVMFIANDLEHAKWSWLFIQL